MHFCNQRKQYVEPSIILDKNPIKLVTEAKFLGVVFDRTVSCKSHVHYLSTNCLKALDILKVVGHMDGGQMGKLYSAFIDTQSDLNWTMVVLYMGQPQDGFYRNWTLFHHQGHFSGSKSSCESTVLLVAVFLNHQTQNVLKTPV